MGFLLTISIVIVVGIVLATRAIIKRVMRYADHNCEQDGHVWTKWESLIIHERRRCRACGCTVKRLMKGCEW